MKTSSQILNLIALVSVASAGCAKMEFVKIPDNASLVTPNPSPTPPQKLPDYTYSDVVKAGNKQVDFLLVMDDSNSMLADLKKLAASMNDFMGSLEASQIDWQMCLTTTKALPDSAGTYHWGMPLTWAQYSPLSGVSPWVLKKGTTNMNSIFTSTVDTLQIGGGASGDERGIKATYANFLNVGNGCYRDGAAKSVILISDEDERSVGGDQSNVKAKDSATAYQPLEAEDQPANLVALTKTVFGEDVRFTFNSIIVKPGDSVCEMTQDQDTSPSHAGYVYNDLSNLTQGGVGSICDANFATSLNTFKDKIINSLSQISLECDPDLQTLTVAVDGQIIKNYSVSGNVLHFAAPLTEGTKLDMSYDCK
ncbi:vWA domain-containing protein [Bdellovibrio sp. GT3]|uniref:vWA domain-containing protein n=1 Tax=Bdellovibrio sp. GT3 TaxID=3136282 RepID=UPI0030F1AFDD